MADLVVSPVLQVLFERLASPLVKRLGDMWHLTDNFEDLQRCLVYARVALEDADGKQLIDEDVRAWILALKRIVYEAEELLDEIESIGALSRTEIKFLGTPYARRVRDVLSKLQNIRDEGSKLKFREVSLVPVERETSSFVVESEVYGREEDSVKVLEMLLSNEASQAGEVSCIPIVGLGGIGKTTLAQIVFNNERVTQHFDVKIWVFVSDCFDANNILKAIIESLTKERSHQRTLDALESEVLGMLNKKRYLIVLDDVWTEDPAKWDKLRPIFRGGVQGSKILVTTRSKKVAFMTDSPTFPYYLKELSEEACWSIFLRRAFPREEEKNHLNLLPIGREILKKCGGVALAAKTLGSLMRFKREEIEWKNVQDSELWILDKSGNKILPALRLSFFHLPLHLKRCFIFCSIFPRSYEIKKEKLIRLWMAEGLIQRRGESEPESIGNEYFNDLLWMSFFQEVKQCDNGGVIGYRMHDIIYDLARSVAGTEFVILDEGFDRRSCLSQVRHSSVISNFRSSRIPEELYAAKHLRTLLLFSIGDFSKIPYKVFSSFKYLRELDLSGCGLTYLNESIGESFCLSYLDLSNTPIGILPRKIESLSFLQTLNLSGCYNLRRLPNLARMLRLRHLNNSGCVKLTTMSHVYQPLRREYLFGRHAPPFSDRPATFPNDTKLQTLPLFVVGGADDIKLLSLLKLQGSLKITRLGNLRKVPELQSPLLAQMQGLESLGLYWGANVNLEEESSVTRFLERKEIHSSQGYDSDDGDVEPEVVERAFESLQPHQNLKRLLVKGYPGYKFHPWVSAINMTVVELIDCRNCVFLPTLGNLASLKILFLQGMHGVRYIDTEFYGKNTTRPFFALEELVLVDFPNLEEWLSPEGVDMFPSLRKLVVNKCRKLTAMPEIISDVQHLELRDCVASLLDYFRNLTFLQDLVIERVEDLSSFPEAFFVNSPRLTTLEIKSCSQLRSLPSEIGELTALKSLTISWCEELFSLPQDIQSLNALESLKIKSCSQLRSLPSEIGKLTALKSLTISWCAELSSLPQDIQSLNALESLEILDCHNLTALPEIGPGGLSKLRNLSIENCSNLTSVPTSLQHLTSLAHLTIMYCKRLINLPHGIQNLSALQSLTIISCDEFTSLPEELQNLMELRSLEIRSCHSFKALPEGIEKLVSLRSLAISDCPDMRVLPEGIKHLKVLQHLSIQDCFELLSRCRPEGGEDWPKIAHVPYKHIGVPTARHPSEASSSSHQS